MSCDHRVPAGACRPAQPGPVGGAQGAQLGSVPLPICWRAWAFQAFSHQMPREGQAVSSFFLL